MEDDLLLWFLNNISSMIAGTEGVPYFNQNPLPYKQDGLIHTSKYISPPNVFQIHNNVGKSIANNSSYWYNYFTFNYFTFNYFTFNYFTFIELYMFRYNSM